MPQSRERFALSDDTQDVSVIWVAGLVGNVHQRLHLNSELCATIQVEGRRY